MENEKIIKRIKKRDDSVVLFEPNKITDAIFKAMKAVGEDDYHLAKKLTKEVNEVLEIFFKSGYIPTVSNILDLIEKALMEKGLTKVAKAFILYRAQRQKLRQEKSLMLDIRKLTKGYLDQADWRVNENSNINYSLSGLMLHIANSVIANYTLKDVYPKEVADAHRNADMHIHDLGMGISGYSFFRGETVIVKDTKNDEILCLSLENLYNYMENSSIEENGFEIKHIDNYQVLDESGWTNIKRVLRHKTNKKLLSMNSFNGNNLIVTEDHPFITLKQRKSPVQCPGCVSREVIKNRTNQVNDYYKCKSCLHTFKGPNKETVDINQREVTYAENLSCNNYCITPCLNSLEIPQKRSLLSRYDGWFLGLFIAEGYLKSENSICFELNSETNVFEKLIGYLKHANINYSSNIRKRFQNGTIQIEKQLTQTVYINLNSLPVELCKMIRMVGKGSHNKSLPFNFLSLPEQVVGSIVSGVVDGDGVIRNDDKWVSRAVIRLTSKTLLSQIQKWLSILNINSSLSTIDSYGKRNYKGVVIESKKQLYALRFYIPEDKYDTFSECLKIDSNFKFSKKEHSPSLFSNFRKIEIIENDSDYVYDITTSSHSFLCNGVLAHNCAGWSLKQIILEGFNGVAGKTEAVPAKHLNSLTWQMINFIGTLQNEWAGAQAFSSFDTYLAPFVKVDNLSYKEVKQNIQGFVFNMNICSRWGSQSPFSNITLDWVCPQDMKDKPAVVGGKEMDFTYGDCHKEMEIINKALLEVLSEGDAKGRIFTFPIPTYNITKDFDWDSENAQLLFEITAKYGIPYFQNFINSELNPSDVRSMCCRLQMDMRELKHRGGGMFGSAELTGSLGVVTMNLPRIGYLSKSKEELFDRLARLMDLAKTSLEIKRKIVQKNMDNGLMPFSKRYLGTLNNHFSTIGINGMNECLLNFMGDTIASIKGKQLAEEILIFMRNRMQSYQEETEHMFNLEATPAEGTSYRFAKHDKKKYPDIITAGEEEPFYTNSSQLPVNYTTDVFEALELQDSLQSKYTGGTVLHGFIGEKVNDVETCKKLVKRIASNFRLPYFTITPTFSVCPEHGYLAGKKESCPKCEATCEVFSRVVGYYRPINNWNIGKKEEWKHRVAFVEKTSLESKYATSGKPTLSKPDKQVKLEI